MFGADARVPARSGSLSGSDVEPPAGASGPGRGSSWAMERKTGGRKELDKRERGVRSGKLDDGGLCINYVLSRCVGSMKPPNVCLAAGRLFGSDLGRPHRPP